MLIAQGEARESGLERTEFMAACRNGGAAIASALRTLDRSYFAILPAECRRMVRDADLAQELVHETFIRAWRRGAPFHEPCGRKSTRRPRTAAVDPHDTAAHGAGPAALSRPRTPL